MSDKNVFYIIGDEPTSRAKEMSAVIDELLGDEDRSLVVEQFDLADADSDETKARIIEDAVTALSSPPFLTSKRIVVIRDIGAASTDNVASLVAFLEKSLAYWFSCCCSRRRSYLGVVDKSMESECLTAGKCTRRNPRHLGTTLA